MSRGGQCLPLNNVTKYPIKNVSKNVSLICTTHFKTYTLKTTKMPDFCDNTKGELARQRSAAMDPILNSIRRNFEFCLWEWPDHSRLAIITMAKFLNLEKMTFTMDRRTLEDMRVRGEAVGESLRQEGVWQGLCHRHGLDRSTYQQVLKDLEASVEELKDAASSIPPGEYK